MLKQNLKIFFFLIIFFNIFLFSNFVFADSIEFNPQVTLSPDFRHNSPIQIGSDSIGKYLKSIYDYSLVIVGILSTLVMMWGGVLWISSAGNAERVGEAKAWIGAALSGLALALCSYTILFIVNPKLLTFNDLKIEKPNNNSSSSNGEQKSQLETINDDSICPSGELNIQNEIQLNAEKSCVAFCKNGCSYTLSVQGDTAVTTGTEILNFKCLCNGTKN